MRTAANTEDFETVSKISKQLLSLFGTPISQNIQ